MNDNKIPAGLPPDPQAVEHLIEETVNNHMDHVDPSLGFMFQTTFGSVVEWEAEGCFVRDMRGDQWLDALSFMGVFGLGHRHPKVIEAAMTQLQRMPLNARYFFNKPQSDLAKRLVELAPGGKLVNVFFSNSGSEAVDVALKSACLATGRTEIISTRESYHGVTIGSAAISGMKHFRAGIEGLLPEVTWVDFGDIAQLEAAISDRTAAVVMEPVHAGLGSKMAPADYFRKVTELCEKHGAMYISDEVQTCLGRTGKLFGTEHYPGAKPDLLIMGKVLSGGVVPLAATLYSEKIADALAHRLIFNTSTFGSGELACAVGLAAVNAVVDEKMPERAARGGEILGAKLREAAERFPQYIRDVRGVGLMWTIEFHDPAASFFVFPHMVREQKILIAPHLNRVDMIRMSPPLNTPDELLERAGQGISIALEAFAALSDVDREAHAYALQAALEKMVSEEELSNAGVKVED